MKTLRLKVSERIAIPSFLPQKGSFLTQRLVHSISEKTEVTEKEEKDNKIIYMRSPDGKFKIKPECDYEKEILLEDSEFNMLHKNARDADEEEKITPDNYTLAEKLFDLKAGDNQKAIEKEG